MVENRILKKLEVKVAGVKGYYKNREAIPDTNKRLFSDLFVLARIFVCVEGIFLYLVPTPEIIVRCLAIIKNSRAADRKKSFLADTAIYDI